MGGPTGHDAAFADMIQGLKNDAINRGATSLMDEDVGTLGVPDPRILIVGCGGSGNNTLNRITHLGVNGAVKVSTGCIPAPHVPVCGEHVVERSSWSL